MKTVWDQHQSHPGPRPRNLYLPVQEVCQAVQAALSHSGTQTAVDGGGTFQIHLQPLKQETQLRVHDTTLRDRQGAWLGRRRSGLDWTLSSSKTCLLSLSSRGQHLIHVCVFVRTLIQ